MSFWTIFGPVLAALLAHFIIVEVIGFLFSMWFQRKRAKMMAEVERKVASGEINPMDLMGAMQGGGMPGMPGMPMPQFPIAGSDVPVSGTGSTTEGHGQYI